MSNFVLISILLIAGSPGLDLFGVSLFTWISKRTFPSPIMLGVTVIFNAASLKEVSEPSAELEAYGISSPWVIVATWLSKVKIFGLEIVLPIPCDSNAVISVFKTAEPVCFKIPIPLVLPAAVKSVKESVVAPRLAVPEVAFKLPVDPAWTPPMTSPCLL